MVSGEGSLLFEVEGPGMHMGKGCRVAGRGLLPGAGRWIACEGRLLQLDPERLNADLRCSRLETLGPLEHFAAGFVTAGWEDWALEVSQADLPLLDGSGRFAAKVPVGERRYREFASDWNGSERNGHGGWLDARSGREFRVTSKVRLPDGSLQEWVATEANLGLCLEARTFIGIDDLAQALDAGLLLGCVPSQAQILGPAVTEAGRRLARVLGMDPDGLRLNGAERFAGECAAHKVLDLVGDLALWLGRLPRMVIDMQNVGHKEFHALGRGLLAQQRLSP